MHDAQRVARGKPAEQVLTQGFYHRVRERRSALAEHLRDEKPPAA
jgi:hypothetical protein